MYRKEFHPGDLLWFDCSREYHAAGHCQLTVLSDWPNLVADVGLTGYIIVIAVGPPPSVQQAIPGRTYVTFMHEEKLFCEMQRWLAAYTNFISKDVWSDRLYDSR